MPIPHNATVSAPYPTYADFAPPYPFDFDFEPDLALPPSYSSLDLGAHEADTEWQPWFEGSEPEGHAGEPSQEPCPCDTVCVMTVTIQVLGLVGLVYCGMCGYNPFGLQ